MLIMGSAAAHADLYRWVDPQTGSVKFSSVPPPASQPGVEVLPYRGPGSAARPPSATQALELRWRALLGEISQSEPSPAGSALLQQRLRDFTAASAELDRLDPAGVPRRRAEAERALQRLLRVQK